MAWYSGITSSIGDYFSSGSGWSDIFKGVMGGVGAAGASSSAKKTNELDAKQALELVDRQGLQSRKTLAFEQQLQDYAKQLDNQRKRVALDTYGQFSTMKRVAPNYVKPAAPPAPVAPVPTT